MPASGRGLSWVRHGEGLVGWGEAARLEVSGPSALADAAAWWAEYTAGLDVADDLAVPGLRSGAVRQRRLRPGRRDVGVRRARRSSWAAGTASAGSPRWAPHPPSCPSAGSAGWRRTAAPLRRRRPRPGHLVRRRRHRRPRIDAGDLDKVVLARDLLVSAEPRSTPAGCCAGWPPASPTAGRSPSTACSAPPRSCCCGAPGGSCRPGCALAGTARPRGAGAEDDRLAAALLGSAKDRAEHSFAVDSLVRALEPYCATLAAPAEPELLTLANVRHLATDVAGTQRRTAPGLLGALDRGRAPHRRRLRHTHRRARPR